MKIAIFLSFALSINAEAQKVMLNQNRGEILFLAEPRKLLWKKTIKNVRTASYLPGDKSVVVFSKKVFDDYFCRIAFDDIYVLDAKDGRTKAHKSLYSQRISLFKNFMTSPFRMASPELQKLWLPLIFDCEFLFSINTMFEISAAPAAGPPAFKAGHFLATVHNLPLVVVFSKNLSDIIWSLDLTKINKEQIFLTRLLPNGHLLILQRGANEIPFELRRYNLQNGIFEQLFPTSETRPPLNFDPRISWLEKFEILPEGYRVIIAAEGKSYPFLIGPDGGLSQTETIAK